ncbi:bifunctional FdrA/YlbE family protein [Acidaminobacter hydrogenoformans]|uniref:Succinyl-CoA synthetase, alpha subunit n=1 Tax=Acidaminobacter hydrogenoformans DSM 2784 TaxID=1120920 RepID=A0A1G5S1K7_9FIRM|nr:DUF1116 domain-containing protein [Acidaminobacter hydrogenoformans]SCZ79611.1 Succinyl-CoA synthetase, alpha subunit [Acidaminobacter hydrogenoformans DSM 2784]
MLYTVVKANNYQDSISLMLLTNAINALPGVDRSSIMMGTEANKNIFENAGMLTQEAKMANPNDMVIVIDAESGDTVDEVLAEVDKFINQLSVKKEGKNVEHATNWSKAMEMMPDANLAVFSIPGEYAAEEIDKALDLGLNVFSFSDNIPLEDEVALKNKAKEKGLLLMGPDCGTGMISSIPIAFTNIIRPGNIGIAAASGTGIQEVATMIDRLGGGIVHAIGTGGRDLNEAVGGISMKDAILALENHDPTDVIVVISKPPSKWVRDEVVELLQSISKPVVAIFLGEKPEHHIGKVHLAYTLEEAARMAYDLSVGKPVQKNYTDQSVEHTGSKLQENQVIKGLYSGGTLAAEAAMLISEALELGGLTKGEGFLLKAGGHEVLDLGDDMYTQGKPHPMIDPEVRIHKIKEYASLEDTGVILLDVVLGYGAHPDMAGTLAPVISTSLEKAKELSRDLYFVASICGTRNDPQGYDEAVQTLKSAGAIVCESNAEAVKTALSLKGIVLKVTERTTVPYGGPTKQLSAPSEAVMDLINSKPRIINIGVESFNDSVISNGATAIQFDWKPAAGGNKKLIKILNKLNQISWINDENMKVVELMKNGQPFLVDVIPARSEIEVLNQKVLLHAGPPIVYKDMTGPMQGSCIGAVLFEGWADSEQDAVAMLERGEVKFVPCHHVNAVGPMGGITSGSMPVLKIINRLDNTVAYCTMNEGIGKVLRFGAYSDEVIQRLKWMRDTLGPVLSKALQTSETGVNLNVIVAKAITMGDEFHQRNIAASLNFLKEVTPMILKADLSNSEKTEVIEFLAATDQFFLNIMMAIGKSVVDCARKHTQGTIVTTMTRNGREFGIRISGMGDTWFTAPVNTPNGLYFTGYSSEDANPDIGDSAITETIGVGAMAMIAAPGVTRFVGAGGFEDALKVSNEMDEICVANNPNYAIPTWDFKGASLGIDIRKVVETGITPLINTGIAHKKAGIGQVGAGTVRAPLACFEKALEAYAHHLGIEVVDHERD